LPYDLENVKSKLGDTKSLKVRNRFNTQNNTRIKSKSPKNKQCPKPNSPPALTSRESMQSRGPSKFISPATWRERRNTIMYSQISPRIEIKEPKF